MRTVLPILVLASTHMGLMNVILAQGVDPQPSAYCTPTKTFTLDAPNADWRMSEQRDRGKYNTATRALSAAEIVAMVERPKTAEQLLQNIKTAVDRDLLVQKGFYETQVLIKFFAASSIDWHKPKSPWVSQRVATLNFEKSAFEGLHGYARLGRSHTVEPDGRSTGQEHDFVQGAINLHMDKPGIAMLVKSVTDVFGMPILAYKKCGDSGFGHGPSKDDPTCKGQIIYTYSKKDFPSASLAINQADLTVRLDAVERRSPTWDLRSAEGRQRFLCDEDELRDISVLQRGF
jgi:hypothetical protein